MRFARFIPGIGGLADLLTYECKPCAEALTEAAAATKQRDP